MLGLAIGAAVLVLLGGVAFAVTRGAPAAAPAPAQSTSVAPSASTSPDAQDGTMDELFAMLDAHGQALVRGDERGWLAPVDPARPEAVGYFKRLYTTLRTIGVTAWRYHQPTMAPIIPQKVFGDRRQAGELSLDVTYCLVAPKCPPAKAMQHMYPAIGAQPASFRLHVKVEYHNGRWFIAGRSTGQVVEVIGGPVPWAQADLTFARGSRVLVAAPPELASRARAVLAVAERAAAQTDRFIRLAGTPRHRYLVFLATDRHWRSWHGGQGGSAVGYVTPVGSTGMNVVLKMSKLADEAYLLKVLRHEFGHVITLLGTPPEQGGAELLEEGIAEYIAYAPRPATDNPRLHEVRRRARAGQFPTTLDAVSLPESHGQRDSDFFYGLGHLVISCLVDRYGEAKTFKFVTRTQQPGVFMDDASRAILGTPFTRVERSCLGYIRGVLRA